MIRILLSTLLLLITPNLILAGESGDEAVKKEVSKNKETTNLTSQTTNENTANNEKIVENKKEEPVKIDIDKITKALKDKVEPEIAKTQKLNLEDPFSKDLNTTREERKNLSKDSLYPVSSLKLVATILSDDLNNMALIELPGLNNDQVIIQVGQKIGRDQGVVQEINETTMKVVENKKLLTLRIEN